MRRRRGAACTWPDSGPAGGSPPALTEGSRSTVTKSARVRDGRRRPVPAPSARCRACCRSGYWPRLTRGSRCWAVNCVVTLCAAGRTRPGSCRRRPTAERRESDQTNSSSWRTRWMAKLDVLRLAGLQHVPHLRVDGLGVQAGLDLRHPPPQPLTGGAAANCSRAAFDPHSAGSRPRSLCRRVIP